MYPPRHMPEIANPIMMSRMNRIRMSGVSKMFAGDTPATAHISSSAITMSTTMTTAETTKRKELLSFGLTAWYTM